MAATRSHPDGGPTPARRVGLFSYVALSGDAEPVRGVMEAYHAAAVRQELTARGLRVLEVRGRRRPVLDDLLRSVVKVKSREVVMFCRQLATFVRVGIPITVALETIGEGTGNKRMREACASMVADLQRGSLLSGAIARHPQVLPKLLSDLVKAAEATGRLDEVLIRAAEHFEREAAAKAKVRAALTYPAIVFAMALLVAGGMVIFVLPKFKDLFDQFNAKLPPMTAFLLDFSGFVGDHILYISAGILLFGLAFGRWARRDSGRLAIGRALLGIPIIGPMIRAATIERFCRSLSHLLAAGVPVGTSFGVVVDSTRNPVYQRALGLVGSQVATGDSFSRALRRTGLFPPLVTQMVRVGEETGTLDGHLAATAAMYDQELDVRLKKLTSFIEPALILSVGIMVGIVAVSLVQAIYGFTTAIK